MRLRTLPVSLAGVVAGLGYARIAGHVSWAVFGICLVFATLAQVASNFANEYFDYRAGLDRAGRVGPRRGVTEGDITPRAMLRATLVTLAAACAVGLTLIHWGGWQMLLWGALIAAGVLAYSTGPLPLSHIALGEAAVIAFFGIAPVVLEFYLMNGYLDPYVWGGGIAIGLMGANVLLVNNIRDIHDDRAARKHTLVALAGRRTGSFLYLFNGVAAVWLMGSVWLLAGTWWWIAPAIYLVIHSLLWYKLDRTSGAALNPLLGKTAVLMAAYAVAFAVATFCG